VVFYPIRHLIFDIYYCLVRLIVVLVFGADFFAIDIKLFSAKLFIRWGEKLG